MKNNTTVIAAAPDDDETNKFEIADLFGLTPDQAGAPSPASAAEIPWKKYAQLLAEAIQEATSTPNLSERERERFARNSKWIKLVNDATEIRDYALLEIVETKQWRGQFAVIGDFAKSIGLSRGQIYKCAESARIKVQMAAADLFAVAPKGREIELLAKVEVAHRVAAWQHARKVAQLDGESRSVIEFALRDYCRAIGIKFGKIKENGATNTGLPVEKYVQTSPPEIVEVESQVCDGAEWVNNLSEDEKSVFGALLSLKGWFASSTPAGCDHGTRMASLLAKTVLDNLRPHSDVAATEKALKMVVSKDPSLKRACYNLALHLVAEYVNTRYSRPSAGR